jgi:hypothetical protein
MAVAHDIRTYYEEASLALVGGTNRAVNSAPGSRQIEAWYFESTEAGKLVLAARLAMKEQGAPTPAWFYMAPSHR